KRVSKREIVTTGQRVYLTRLHPGNGQIRLGERASVGGQDGTRNQTRGGTCKKDHRVGNFGRLAEASRRLCCLQHFVSRMAIVAERPNGRAGCRNPFAWLA